MGSELTNKLALLYVELNAAKGASAKEIYQMYKTAFAEIEEAKNEAFKKGIEDGSWGL